MPLTLLPDVEKAAIDYLAASTDLTSAGCQHVGGRIAGPYPMVRVLRTGGPSGIRLDAASLQIDVVGAESDQQAKPTLNTIARTALAVLLRMRDDHTLTGLAVSWVQITSALQWQPDPTTQQGRYVSSVLIYAHSS